MKNNFILITGASSGIGRALSLKLANIGYQVFASVRNINDANDLQKLSNGIIVPLQMDITNQSQIDLAFDKIHSLVGEFGLTALINNAGIVVSGPLEFITISDMQLQIETNLIGTLRVTQAALPLLRKAKGKILNIGSPSGRIALPFLAPYSASKAAVMLLTQALRFELYTSGVQATLVEPGDIATPIWEKSRLAALNRRNQANKQIEIYYGKSMDQMEVLMIQTASRAIKVDIVVQKIIKLLQLKKLKPVYGIGFTAFFWRIISNLLPQRIVEHAIHYVLSNPKNKWVKPP